MTIITNELTNKSNEMMNELTDEWIVGDLSKGGIRLRLYSSERLRRERLLGEALVGLASLALHLQRQHQLLVTLNSKSVF